MGQPSSTVYPALLPTCPSFRSSVKKAKTYEWCLLLPGHENRGILVTHFCYDKTLTKTKLEKKEFVLTYHPGSQGRNSRQRHGGILLSGLFSMACSGCFVYNLRPSAQAWHHLGWAGPFPHQPLIKTISQRHAHGLMWLKQYLNWGFLFPQETLACVSVDKKLNTERWTPDLKVIRRSKGWSENEASRQRVWKEILFV